MMHRLPALVRLQTSSRVTQASNFLNKSIHNSRLPTIQSTLGASSMSTSCPLSFAAIGLSPSVTSHVFRLTWLYHTTDREFKIKANDFLGPDEI